MNIDMSYMVYVSKESGLLTEEEKQRIISCMIGLKLPVWHEACTMELIQKSLQDRLKHSGGLVRMPLPVGLGQAGKNHNSNWCLHSLREKNFRLSVESINKAQHAETEQ